MFSAQVLTILVFSLADCTARGATALRPRLAAPGARKHAALHAANAAAAAAVVLTCALRWPDGVLLFLHAALGVTSSWLCAVCFSGADARAAARRAAPVVRERTGTVMQGLLLLGVLLGLSLSTVIARVRETESV